MQELKTIWQNGKLIPWAEAKVHVLSHTLHYGGGAFEGIRFYNTTKGPAIFRLHEHVKRLLYSAQILHIQLPYSKEDIVAAIKDVIRANKLVEGYIRPIAFYGYGKLGVKPADSAVELAIACWNWGAYLANDYVDVKISSYKRIHPDSTIIEAKLCGHYVNSILAALELEGTPYHEALLLDSDGFIAEGVGENFFMVKNGIIYTPKLGAILPGITRDTIIQLAKQLNLELLEANITPTKVYTADEAFFTGTAVEVTAIRSINDHLFNEGRKGMMTIKIKEAYFDAVYGRNPAFAHYLTYIED